MKKAFVLVPCLFAASMFPACADEDSATTDTPQPAVDAAADSTTSAESATNDDASSQEDVSSSSDGSQAEGAIDGGQGDAATNEAGGDADAGLVADGDAGTISPDSGGREAGPGGDGGLVIVGDAAAADATFQIQSQSGTNLLSSSDVHTDCTGVAGAPAGVYVVTCREKTGSTGPCRTVTITLGTNSSTGPTTGLTLTAVNKTAPAVGEALVVYQESIDCTEGNTNGWTVASPGGTVKVDVRGDTGMNFTVTNVPLGPAAPGGPWNVNAAGTFALSGSGFSTLPFGG